VDLALEVGETWQIAVRGRSAAATAAIIVSENVLFNLKLSSTPCWFMAAGSRGFHCFAPAAAM
jgi:hypothetical protein